MIIKLIRENARPVLLYALISWNILVEGTWTRWWITLLEELVLRRGKWFHLATLLLFKCKLSRMIMNQLRLLKLVYNTTFSFNNVVFWTSNLIVKETIIPLLSSFYWFLSELCQKALLTVGHFSLVNDNLLEFRFDLLDDVWLDALFRGYDGA